ncbi:hypothetical protein N8Z10_00120 [bacterium]|nr:hypothetical protein [bacterium]
MVRGYTADTYGDFFIASLQEPYRNVIMVLDWEILVGLKTPLMTGTVSGQAGTREFIGNLTQLDIAFSIGDTIIVGNIEYTIDSIPSSFEIGVAETISNSITGAQYYGSENADNRFEYGYRWSQTGDVFSEINPLKPAIPPQDIGYGDLLAINFDVDKPVYIDTTVEVAAIQNLNTLTFLSITHTLETGEGTIIACPNFCTECTDPFAMNGCANIIVSCDDDNLFNPYNLTKSNNIYKQLTSMITGIFGHEVNYFRTEPDLRTSDVILMEYSLHNVVDNKSLKVLVPDNEFPTEANTYDIFGIDLEDFEVHITAEEFESIFGAGKSPRNKDYMYIPIINKMYEISSIALADEFNKTNSYWRVKLTKYQDRTSVVKGTFDAATDVLVTGIDELFGEEINNEYRQSGKPEQFKSVISSYRDGIRDFLNKGLNIVDYDLKNSWTVVSKNYYDLSSVTFDTNVIGYVAKSEVLVGNSAAFTGWFSPKFDAASTVDHYLFGDNDALLSGGFRLTISNTEFKLSVNGWTESYQHGMTLQNDTWYGYVVNVNNVFSQLSLSLYSLDPNSNVITKTSSPTSMNLILEFNENRNMSTPITWQSSTNYGLRANNMYMTNIRVFEQPIEFEQHSNVLNQYVVRDNQLAIVIDNAIPSLGFQKFANAR